MAFSYCPFLSLFTFFLLTRPYICFLSMATIDQLSKTMKFQPTLRAILVLLVVFSTLFVQIIYYFNKKNDFKFSIAPEIISNFNLTLKKRANFDAIFKSRLLHTKSVCSRRSNSSTDFLTPEDDEKSQLYDLPEIDTMLCL